MPEMTIRELRDTFEDHGIRRVKLGGFDIDGVLRGKYVSAEKFWSSAEKGFGFCDVIFGWDSGDVLYDNSQVTGWHTGYPDILAKIDLSTFRVLPDEPATAAFVVDFHVSAKTPHPACPRNLLKKVAARADELGFSAKFSAEFEFWIFRETPASLESKGYRHLEPLSPGMFGYSWVRSGQNAELVHDILDTMESFDIDIEALHTETGPGVYEACIRYDDIVRAADMAALFKTTMKTICARHGVIPTFMAKWNESLPGSSGHIHQSVWSRDGARNLFSDSGSNDGLSELARFYAGGQLACLPDLTAIYSPTINSYRRYVPGVWAPLTATWGAENRTCAVRSIVGPSPSATRLEYRQTAADINPYLAMAACLASGLYGIEQSIAPPSPSTGDASGGQSAAAIPRSLGEATRRLDESAIARQILGDDFVDHYVRTRTWEIKQQERAVTDWELRRYFEVV